MNNPKWPEDDELEAVRLWKTGASAGDISKALDGRYSRSAVLGKIGRLHLARSAKPKAPKKPKAKQTLEYRIRSRHSSRQTPSEIAAHLGLRKAAVEAMLVEMGLDPLDNIPEPYKVHPMWSMEEDQRRAEFISKYEQGMVGVRARYREDRLKMERTNAAT